MKVDYFSTNDIVEAAGGDWILEAYEDYQDTPAFLVACFALMLKEGSADKVVKFLRHVADVLEMPEAERNAR